MEIYGIRDAIRDALRPWASRHCDKKVLQPGQGLGADMSVVRDQVSLAPNTGDTLQGAGLDLHILLQPPFRLELGKCWLATLREHILSADSDAEPQRSTGLLRENGVPLGPPHAQHSRIREVGDGAFSHWKDTLYFSTSDGTDPNSNGRTYELVFGRSIGVAGNSSGQATAQRPPRSAVPAEPLTLRARYYLLQSLAHSGQHDGVCEETALFEEIVSIERQLIEESGRFDAEFYSRSYGATIPAHLSPVNHFITTGHTEGLLASPRFDPVVYKILHPLRRIDDPLIDCILLNDDTDYRDVRALFNDIAADRLPITIRYAPEIRREWIEKAGMLAAHRDRTARISWNETSFALRNPSPNDVFARFTENRPFCFARLPHGFWDDFDACNRLSHQLKEDGRCRLLNEHEVFNLSVRLIGSSRMTSSNQCYESFFTEIAKDLTNHPRHDDFWTALSLKGVPTFDDALEGFSEEDVKSRVELLQRFFRPSDVLYDAMLWKRWAISGDLAYLPDALRDHWLIVVGPPKFSALGAKWTLSRFSHVEIPIDFSHLVRGRMLQALEEVIAKSLAAAVTKAPVILFQCSGELSYWLMRRLWPRFPEVFYIDLGQALDLWAWNPESVWAQIYGDAVRSANPALGSEAVSAEQRGHFERVVVASYEEVSRILRSDYLDTGLVTPPVAERIIELPREFQTEGAYGWKVMLPPELRPLTDNDDFPTRSPLVLLEDNRVLGAGHNLHVSISDQGSGLYSFWKGQLYFSTSDNSNPMSNGRKYEIGGRVEFLSSDAADGKVVPIAHRANFRGARWDCRNAS